MNKIDYRTTKTLRQAEKAVPGITKDVSQAMARVREIIRAAKETPATRANV